jgi:ATP-dependent protease ClpP protease subunit
MTRRTKLRLGYAAWMLLVFAIMFGHCAYKAWGQTCPATPQVGSFYLWGAITDDTAEYVLEYLKESPAPVLYLNTPGGHRDASTVIAEAVKAKGNVRCIVKGQASSGGFAILQACHTRVMTAKSKLGTHEPRYGTPFPLDRTLAAELVRQLEEASRSWNDYNRKRLKLTAAEYEAKVRGRDWIMGPAEALEVGAVDLVLP